MVEKNITNENIAYSIIGTILLGIINTSLMGEEALALGLFSYFAIGAGFFIFLSTARHSKDKKNGD